MHQFATFIVLLLFPLFLFPHFATSSSSPSERYTRQSLTFGKSGSLALLQAPTVHISSSSDPSSIAAAEEAFKCLVLSGVRRIKCHGGLGLRGAFKVDNPDVEVVEVVEDDGDASYASGSIALVFGAHSPSIESHVRSKSGSYIHVALSGSRGCLTSSVNCLTTDGDGVKVKDVHVERNKGGTFRGERHGLGLRDKVVVLEGGDEGGGDIVYEVVRVISRDEFAVSPDPPDSLIADLKIRRVKEPVSRDDSNFVEDVWKKVLEGGNNGIVVEGDVMGGMGDTRSIIKEVVLGEKVKNGEGEEGNEDIERLVGMYMGAVAGGEVLKIITGVFTTIERVMAVDFDPPSTGKKKQTSPRTVKKVFVVGAGAIGCEVLKSISLLSSPPSVIVTDLDKIERSNLSRQMLFGDEDIGGFKSEVAARKVRECSGLDVEAMTKNIITDVGPEVWSEVDVVMSCLDNREARLHCARMCAKHGKVMIDMGTLGAKGNTFVSIPGETERWDSSEDGGDEEGVPVCTVKQFPNEPEHCVMWGKEVFEEVFVRGGRKGGSGGGDENEEEEEEEEKAGEEEKRRIGNLYKKYGLGGGEEDLGVAVGFAKELYEQYIINPTADLLEQYPKDHKDEDGFDFWGGKRRRPKLVGWGGEEGLGWCKGAVKCWGEVWGRAWEEGWEEKVEEMYKEGKIRSLKVTTKKKPKNLIFEKDDPTNGHMNFIHCASKIRCLSYGIKALSPLETRKVAGNIIPAMITTTSVIGTLGVMELAKISLGKRALNAFVNLAVNTYCYARPTPCERRESRWIEGGFTEWDAVNIRAPKKGEIKVGGVIRKLRKIIGDDVEIGTISVGDVVVYVGFLNGQDEEVMKTPFWEYVNEAYRETIEEEEEEGRGDGEAMEMPDFDKDNTIDVRIVCEGEEGEIDELPVVRVERRRIDE